VDRHELTQRARTAVRGDEAVALAQRLVRIPTENPPGDTREAAAVLADWLEGAGFSCELFERCAPHTSLIAERTFADGGRTLVLNGHLDVVPAGSDWSGDPFSGEIRAGKLYGRGSLDMKGAVAAMAGAAAALARTDLPLQGRLVVMAVADEEQGGVHGSGAIIDADILDADAIVIGEPSDRGVVIGHRGTCFLRLRTHGVAGHASMPSKAENAVERMLAALTACGHLELPHSEHPLLGRPSVALGTTINGGTKMNVIPDHCEATIDIRTVPGMNSDEIVAQVENHLRKAGFQIPNQVEVERIVASEVAITAPDAEIVTLAAEAQQREFGSPAVLQGMPATTDGWWFANRAGLPTVMGLGPGSIERCHIANECVDVAELGAYARIYADLAAQFLAAA
jgi:acetylornithine deacetylase/succinyl-diaminopimelate desuccinylase family protein